MCVSIWGSMSFSSALAAGHRKLKGRQFLTDVVVLAGLNGRGDYRFVPYLRYLSNRD